MSLFGATLRPKTIPNVSKIAGALWPSVPRSQPSTRAARCKDKSSRPKTRDNSDGSVRRNSKISNSFEDIFIKSLVQASTCRSCAPHFHRTTPPGWNSTGRQQLRRNHNNALAPVESKKEGGHVSRQQYKELVNTYNFHADLWHPPPQPPPSKAHARAPPGHVPLAPRLVITPEQEDQPPYTKRRILPPEDPDHARQIKRLEKILHKFDSKPGDKHLRREAFQLYETLRPPRPRYLSDHAIRKLFRSIAWMEHKDIESAHRVFALIDECVGENVPLTEDEWNVAIAFAARLIQYPTKEEVKSAVEMWMRMENNGVAANHVTFNILFDVCVRAGRFALADTIYAELKTRGMQLDRFFRTSMIYYAGRKRSGDAVRQAFQEFVNAGEIVSTSVMNCVIMSLLRAGEPASAEHVFLKMKHLHATKFGAAGPRDWEESRHLSRQLDATARQLRRDKQAHEASFFGAMFASDDKREEAQRAAPIHPNQHSYELLIKHHAIVSGNLARVEELVKELREGGYNVSTTIYSVLFGGFHLHGGNTFTAWSRDSLEAYFDEFLGAMGDAPEPFAEDADPVSDERGVDATSPVTHADAQFPPSEEDSTPPVSFDAVAGSIPFAEQHDAPSPAPGEHSPPPAFEVSEVRFTPFAGKGPAPSTALNGQPPMQASIHTEAASKIVESQLSEDDDDLSNEETEANQSEIPAFDTRLAIRAVRAFYRCAGRKKMEQVWTVIQRRWKGMPTKDKERVGGVVERLCRQDQIYLN